QTAIITGAAQGIGAETAAIFARENCKVVIADIDAGSYCSTVRQKKKMHVDADTKTCTAKAETTAQAINADGGAAIAVGGDITNSEDVGTLVQKAAEFGGGKLHIIVNNAGYAWDDPIEKIQDKQWGEFISLSSDERSSQLVQYSTCQLINGEDTIIALHNTAPFQLVRAAAPYFMLRDGEPRSIVNVSSTSGIHGNAGQASYALAKAGLVGLTKTLALEWGPEYGVRANTVAFGAIKTRLTQAPAGEYVVRPDGTKHAVGFQGGYDEEEKWQVSRIPRVGDIPLGRVGTPTDAGRAILAMVSPLFSYVTGQTIMVSGGKGGM
ncbi:3-oxoacyl-[acyl-carrier-protein] reductase 3-like protein, partial [Lachnellula willkommii]